MASRTKKPSSVSLDPAVLALEKQLKEAKQEARDAELARKQKEKEAADIAATEKCRRELGALKHDVSLLAPVGLKVTTDMKVGEFIWQSSRADASYAGVFSKFVTSGADIKACNTIEEPDFVQSTLISSLFKSAGNNILKSSSIQEISSALTYAAGVTKSDLSHAFVAPEHYEKTVEAVGAQAQPDDEL